MKRQVVAVAPTTTVVVSPMLASPGVSALTLEVINDDLAQSVGLQFEKSREAAGPWAVSSYTGLATIAPGETRFETVSIDHLEAVRITGTASGGGANIRITAIMFSDLP